MKTGHNVHEIFIMPSSFISGADDNDDVDDDNDDDYRTVSQI